MDKNKFSLLSNYERIVIISNFGFCYDNCLKKLGYSKNSKIVMDNLCEMKRR